MKKKDGNPNLPIKIDTRLSKTNSKLIKQATIIKKALSDILGSRDPDFWLRKARLSLDKQAWQDAINHCQKALRYDDTYVKADIIIAYAFGRLPDFENSISYIKRINRNGEVDAETYRSLLNTLELFFLSVFYKFNYEKVLAEKLEAIAQPIKLELIDEGLTERELEEIIEANPDIHYLNLEDNQLSSLPESIGNLKNLTSLDLRGNTLSSLPESIGNLKNLTSLDLRGNTLSSLPESIGNWKNLASLDLSNNTLSSLPESIGNWKNLTSLGLWDNQLSSLPESIGNWKNLTSLDLSSNKLSSLPESIGNWKNLDQLYLGGNQLSSLPESIGNLKDLSLLYLRGNQLSSLPESIGNLNASVIK